MIYPAYKVTGADGKFRTFFWFCFARLKELDEYPRRYGDFLDSDYERESRRPYWAYELQDGYPEEARDVVKIEAAFHCPNWNDVQINIVASHSLFGGMNITTDGEFVVCSVDTTNKCISEIMYPLFMLRNILCKLDLIESFELKGLPFIQAAFLASQFYTAKDYTNKEYHLHIGEDYRLADTFEGLASVLLKPMTYSGPKWGHYSGGYVENDYYSLPEDTFEITDGTNIEDFTEDFGAKYREIDTAQVLVEAFSEALEKVNG